MYVVFAAFDSIKDFFDQFTSHSVVLSAGPGALAMESAEAFRLIQQMFIALFSLHRLDITHGDVGPHNIFLVRSSPTATTVRVGDISRVPRKRRPTSTGPPTLVSV